VLNIKTAEAIGITFAEALLATIDEAIRRRQSEALANDEQFRHLPGFELARAT
jgi:hypothetical protein